MPTFPTAFWKTRPPASVGVGTNISWETGLWWSHGDGSPALQNFSLKQTSSFPFAPVVSALGGALDEYYTEYDNTTTINYDEGTASSTYAYHGWFLHGGKDLSEQSVDLSSWHSLEPWVIGESGLGLSLSHESDFTTAFESGYLQDDENYGNAFSNKTFNKFIQSGEATGTFTLTTTSILTMQVSGLGCDTSYNYNESLSNQPDLFSENRNSIFANHLVVSLYSGEAFAEEIFCSGMAPRDDRLLSNSSLKDQTDLVGGSLTSNIDMQQVKLYSGAQVGIGSVVNTSQGDDTGEPRGNPTEWVEQNNRIAGGYTTTNGIGTFTTGNLGAGEYQLRVKISSYDNIFNSGAFYGLKFNFSQP